MIMEDPAGHSARSSVIMEGPGATSAGCDARRAWRPPGAGMAPAPDCGRMQEAAPGRTGQEATTR